VEGLTSTFAAFDLTLDLTDDAGVIAGDGVLEFGPPLPVLVAGSRTGRSVTLSFVANLYPASPSELPNRLDAQLDGDRLAGNFVWLPAPPGYDDVTAPCTLDR
jgi:hypothetical protein